MLFLGLLKTVSDWIKSFHMDFEVTELYHCCHKAPSVVLVVLFDRFQLLANNG